MNLPSGQKLTQHDQELLLSMVSCGLVRYSETPFTLRSKIESHVYVFGREDLTDNPMLERKVGVKIADVVQANSEPDAPMPCLIGLPTAGTVLAQAGAMMSGD